MNTIEQMIHDLCPDGVKRVRLGEVGFFYSGLSGKSKKDFEDGNAKFITYKNVYSNPALKIDVDDTVKIAPDEKQNTIQYGDILFTGSSETPDECAFSSVLNIPTDEKLYLNSFCFGFRFNDLSQINIDFYKHYFRCLDMRKRIAKTANGTTRFNVSKKDFAQLVIPLPPLSIQAEIVKILDRFAVLSAELEAELEARRKQYEYYRTRLLSFDSDSRSDTVQWRALGEILDYEQPTKYIVADTNYDDSYVTPVLTAGQSFILGYTKEQTGIYKANKDNPVIIFDDFTTSFHWVDFDFKVKSSAMKMLKPKTNDNFRYIYYAMQTISFIPSEHTRHWISKYSQFTIPIPPLAEQERIVNILDKFDQLVNGVKDSIPELIDKVQKQYEYYRNKLLTFPEA